jgi:predicted amidophosphoribosyltransferase
MKRRGPSRRRSIPTSYAGPTTCLRCDQEFSSWDRRQNRLCPRCWNELDQEPSEEPSHELPTPIHRSRLREDG